MNGLEQVVAGPKISFEIAVGPDVIIKKNCRGLKSKPLPLFLLFSKLF